MSLLLLLLVLLVICSAVGFAGHAAWGVMGFSPVGLLVVVLLILYFTGHLHR